MQRIAQCSHYFRAALHPIRQYKRPVKILAPFENATVPFVSRPHTIRRRSHTARTHSWALEHRSAVARDEGQAFNASTSFVREIFQT